MPNYSFIYIYVGVVMAGLVLGFAGVTFAYVASSTNYRLEEDSINTGGRLSTSTSYGLEDTLGEIATGYSSSTNYLLHAGYQQVSSSTLSISSPSDVTLSPSIDGRVGGTANGSATWTVTTSSATGYTLSISASTNPALQSSSDSFANYTAGSDPDFSWSVGSSVSEFGFTPEGSDIATRFKDNGTSCNLGSSDTSLSCWDAITTTNATIASRATAAASGATTTVNFRAEAGATRDQSAGTYQATITVTAVAI